MQSHHDEPIRRATISYTLLYDQAVTVVAPTRTDFAPRESRPDWKSPAERIVRGRGAYPPVTPESGISPADLAALLKDILASW